jgi:hypothetical protein
MALWLPSPEDSGTSNFSSIVIVVQFSSFFVEIFVEIFRPSFA